MPANQIARPSKSGHPNPVFQSRVPPDVIGVKMRAHHKINVIGGKTDAGEALEIRRLQTVKNLVCWKVLVVPNAAIDQDRMSAVRNTQLWSLLTRLPECSSKCFGTSQCASRANASSGRPGRKLGGKNGPLISSTRRCGTRLV